MVEPKLSESTINKLNSLDLETKLRITAYCTFPYGLLKEVGLCQDAEEPTLSPSYAGLTENEHKEFSKVCRYWLLRAGNNDVVDAIHDVYEEALEKVLKRYED